MRLAFWLGVLLLACCPARAEEPVLTVQGGPRQTIRAAKVSPSGDLLATLDGSLLQLWTRDGGVLWSRSVTGDAHALAWSRDGKKLAVGFGGLAGFYVFKAGDLAGTLELDARDGRALLTLLQGNNAAYEIAYLPDGRLTTRSDGGNPFVWDEAAHESKLEGIYGRIFPSPASDAVAVLTTGIQLWDANLKTKLASLWQKGMPAQTLSWSPKGAKIAVANRERVQLWSATQRALEREIVLPAPASPTSYDSIALAWTPDEKTLLVARTDFPDAKPDDPETGETRSGAPRLFLASINAATGALQTLRSGERRAITALDFWPDKTLVWGGADDDEPPYGDAELYFARVESDAVKAVWSAPQPLEAPRVAELSPDGRTLAVGGDDTAIRLWNLKSGRLEKTLKELSGQIVALSWSPSGKQIAALDYQNLFVFDIESGNGRTFKGTSYFVGQLPTVSWSPDEKQIALSGADGTFIFDLPTAKRRELKNPDSTEEGMDSIFGPVRWTRAGLETSGGLQLIDPKTGRTLRTLNATGVASERGHLSLQFAWIDRGRKLLTRGSDWEDKVAIKRWDVPGNRVERTLKTEFMPREFALAPDEKSFAVGGENGELALFDTQTFESIWQRDVGAPVNALVWSGNGDTIFCVAEDGWTSCWNVAGVLQSRLAALPARGTKGIGYEWIHLAPDQRYIAFKTAAPQVRWRIDGELKPLNAAGAPVETLPLSTPNVARTVVPGLTVASQPPTAPPKKEKTSETNKEFPKLVLQGLAGAGQFRAMAVSPDARWIVTHNGDQNVTLWDGKESLLWGDIPALRDRVPLFFSPEGVLLFCSPTDYSGDNEKYKTLEVRRIVRRIPGGELVRRFELQAPYWSDGKTVRGLKNGAVESWNITSGQKTAQQILAEFPKNRSTAFSPDGAFLVAGADYEKDRAARVWRVSGGAKVSEIKDKLRVIGRAAVSADARFIASEGDDPNWSPPTDGPMTESAYARTFKIHLWNAQTRALLFTYNGYYSLSGGAQLLQFSPDGKFLFSAGSDGGLRRLEIATKSVLEIPPTPKSSQSPLDWPIALAPDMRCGAGVTRSEAITTFDTTTQKLGTPFASPLSNPDKVWWSPDGRYLFGGGFLFNARTGELLATGARAGEISDVLWKNHELWTSSFERVTRWKIPSLEKIAEWEIRPSQNLNDFSSGYNDGVRLSPDARFVLTVEPESSGLRKPGVWVWDAVTHELLRTIMPDFGPFNSDLSRLRFFPSGDKVLRPTKNGLELWDLTTGEKLQTWHDPIDPKFEVNDFGGVAALFALAVSPDEKLIAARAARDSSIWIFDLKNPNSPLQLLIKAGYNAQFLSDSRTLLAQTGEEKWQEWDARGDGRAPLRKLGTIGRQLQLSPDDKLAAVTSPFFGGLKIWDRTRDAEAARIYLADASRFSSPENPARPGWIALTPQGFYNASPSAEKYLRWRDEHEFWLLQKSRAEFFRPDKVRAALQPR